MWGWLGNTLSRVRATHSEIFGVAFPEFVDKTGVSDTCTPGQLTTARDLLKQLESDGVTHSLEVTVQEWFSCPVGNLNRNTMMRFIQVLRRMIKAGKEETKSL